MESFNFVIYHDGNKTAQVLTGVFNDTILSNNIASFQSEGINVRCNATPDDVSDDDLKKLGYTIDRDLYNTCWREYYTLTGKRLDLGI